MGGPSTAVVASACQPVHDGHRAVLQQALELAPRVVLLCLAADSSPSLRSPWRRAERLAWLRRLAAGDERVTVRAVPDVSYVPRRWQRRLAATVPPGEVVLLSDARDVPWPAHWQPRTPLAALDTTAEVLRRCWIGESEAQAHRAASSALDSAQRTALEHWRASEEGQALREEARFLSAFRASWAVAPYPPVFVTVDALVTWRRRVLLIQRGRPPGKGLWALPGGFVDPDEALLDAARREAAEETGLDVSALQPADSAVFDAPARSLRGRTITHVFRFDLATHSQPAVRGGDDAALAAWVERADIVPERLFEDHFQILQRLLNLP